MITEQELVGLLYRADWTKLALSGTVSADGPVIDPGSGAFGVTDTGFGGRARPWEPEPPPWFLEPDQHGRLKQVSVAPGRRFRVEDADRSRAVGSDGERLWAWRQDQSAPAIRFSARPQPPYRVLLMPSWLLNGYALVTEDEVTACGRAGLRVRATPKPTSERRRQAGYRPLTRMLGELPRWLRERRYEAVDAVVDAELGILLRCTCHFDGEPPLVTGFESLDVGEAVPADAARFSGPTGSVYSGAPAVSPLQSLGQEAVKLAAGITAGGLGALLKYAPSRRADPFAQATTEDFEPDDVMPADDLALDGPPSAAVSREALYALYRDRAAAPRFAATLHEWFDGDGLFEAIPESARQAGFGGIGFLADTVRERLREDGPVHVHEVTAVRLGGWREFRLDVLRRPGPAGKTGWGRDRERPGTVAGDGTREWRVFADRVVVSEAAPVPPELTDLIDPSWLLECDLSDGAEVTVAGRRGYRIVARPRETANWWDRVLFPAEAVVDAETGLLLRLTRFTGGQPVARAELRDIAEPPPDADFGFSPPDGRPLVD